MIADTGFFIHLFLWIYGNEIESGSHRNTSNANWLTLFSQIYFNYYTNLKFKLKFISNSELLLSGSKFVESLPYKDARFLCPHCHLSTVLY